MLLIEVTAVLTAIWLGGMHLYLRPVRTVIRARSGK